VFVRFQRRTSQWRGYQSVHQVVNTEDEKEGQCVQNDPLYFFAPVLTFGKQKEGNSEPPQHHSNRQFDTKEEENNASPLSGDPRVGLSHDRMNLIAI
jgi:hypothetical protein